MTVIPVPSPHQAHKMAESYSADKIASTQPIRQPFQYEADLWCVVSMAGSALTSSREMEMQAYRVVAQELFKAPTTTYADKVLPDHGETARADPLGFYNAIRVEFKGAKCILKGPPVTFVCPKEATRPEPEAQLSLFGEASP